MKNMLSQLRVAVVATFSWPLSCAAFTRWWFGSYRKACSLTKRTGR